MNETAAMDKKRLIVSDTIHGIEKAIQKNDSTYMWHVLGNGEYAWTEGCCRQYEDLQRVLFDGTRELLKLDSELDTGSGADQNVLFVQYYGSLCFAWCAWVTEKKSRKASAKCATAVDTVTNDMNLGGLTEDEYRRKCAESHNELPIDFMEFGVMGERLVEPIAKHQICPLIERPQNFVGMRRLMKAVEKRLASIKRMIE